MASLNTDPSCQTSMDNSDGFIALFLSFDYGTQLLCTDAVSVHAEFVTLRSALNKLGCAPDLWSRDLRRIAPRPRRCSFQDLGRDVWGKPLSTTNIGQCQKWYFWRPCPCAHVIFPSDFGIWNNVLHSCLALPVVQTHRPLAIRRVAICR